MLEAKTILRPQHWPHLSTSTVASSPHASLGSNTRKAQCRLWRALLGASREPNSSLRLSVAYATEPLPLNACGKSGSSSSGSSSQEGGEQNEGKCLSPGNASVRQKHDNRCHTLATRLQHACHNGIQATCLRQWNPWRGGAIVLCGACGTRGVPLSACLQGDDLAQVPSCRFTTANPCVPLHACSSG
eukprot:573135-Pelagomonas_calceolata.AAC.3